MSIILRLIPAAIIVAFVLLITPPALASTDASGSRLTQAIEEEIMWLSANVASNANDTIRIKIFNTSGKHGHRSLWQVCKFGSTGTGEYRCGIDVAPGSSAEKRQGAWIAKLFIGSELVARTKFFL